MSLDYQNVSISPRISKTSTIKYREGSTVPRQHQAVYLGTVLSDTIENNFEIHNRLAMVTRTCFHLKLFWNKANTSTTWKLQIFNENIKTNSSMASKQTSLITQNEMEKICFPNDGH